MPPKIGRFAIGQISILWKWGRPFPNGGEAVSEPSILRTLRLKSRFFREKSTLKSIFPPESAGSQMRMDGMEGN